MFAGKYVPYVYSISVFINKQKRKWIQTNMSLKYASIHQITPIFRNVYRKHDPEPPPPPPPPLAGVCVVICTIVLFFV